MNEKLFNGFSDNIKCLTKALSRTMAVSMTMMSGRVGVVLGNSFFPFLLAVSCSGTFVSIGTVTLCKFIFVSIN